MEILSQDAKGDFSGTWANSLGSLGPITGSVRGEQAVFHISGRNGTCSGEGDGEGTFDLSGAAPRLEFVVSGYDCTGSYPPLLGEIERQ